MSRENQKDKAEIELYSFGIEMFEAAQEESVEQLAEWADSREGGLQCFFEESQKSTEEALRKARYALAKQQSRASASRNELVSKDEAEALLLSNPEELPIAARNMERAIDGESMAAIASIIKERKKRGIK